MKSILHATRNKLTRSFGRRGTSYNMLTTLTTKKTARDNVISAQRNNGFNYARTKSTSTT